MCCTRHPPQEIRGQLWKAFLGVDRKRVPGAYEQLVEAGLQHAAAAAAAKAAADAAAAAANSASSTALHADGRIGVQRAAGASAGLANAGSSSSSLAQQTSGNSDASTVTPFATAAEAETAAGSNLSPGAPAAGASLPRTPAASLKSQPSAADWAIQISKDLHRTFPGHAAMDDNGRAALRRILLAYAQYNPFVGYCQVPVVFLLRLLERDAEVCVNVCECWR